MVGAERNTIPLYKYVGRSNLVLNARLFTFPTLSLAGRGEHGLSERVRVKHASLLPNDLAD